MDYEKKYKEALGWMQSLYNGLHGKTKEEAERYFPELKESENEKVIRALAEMVHDTIGDELWVDYNVHKEEALTWIEKQGEKKETDKVEPKFNAGDWVVISTPDGEKVVQIDSIEYFKSGEPRYITSEGRWFGNGTESHLWTTQDAKDGDIIATEPIKSYPFPFVAIYKNHCLDSFNSYCFIGFNGKFYEGEDGHSMENIHPATKEQRDQLERAMFDAGYRWNKEELKLEKI